MEAEQPILMTEDGNSIVVAQAQDGSSIVIMTDTSNENQSVKPSTRSSQRKENIPHQVVDENAALAVQELDNAATEKAITTIMKTAFVSEDGTITWESTNVTLDPNDEVEMTVIDTLPAAMPPQATPKSKQAKSAKVPKDKSNIRHRTSKASLMMEEVSLGSPIEQTEFLCVVCNNYLENARALTHHLRYAHSSDQDFGCIICEKAFTKNNLLMAHLRRHSGEKPHFCVYCDKTFADSNDLRQHRRTHPEDEKYRPPSERKIKNFMCGFCNQLFANPVRLKKHLVSHSSDRNYNCLKCGASYKHDESLKNHWKRSGCTGGPATPVGRKTLQRLYTTPTQETRPQPVSLMAEDGAEQDMKTMLASIIPEGVEMKDLTIRYTEQGQIEITLPSIESFQAVTESVHAQSSGVAEASTSETGITGYGTVENVPQPATQEMDDSIVDEVQHTPVMENTPQRMNEEEADEVEEDEEAVDEIDDKIEFVEKPDVMQALEEDPFEDMDTDEHATVQPPETPTTPAATTGTMPLKATPAKDFQPGAKRPYKCTHKGCRVAYSSQTLLDMHLITHQKMPLIKCGVCNEDIPTEAFGKHSIKEHTDTSDSRFVCKVCDIEVSSRRTLLRHVISHTSAQVHVCHTCHKSYNSSSDLKSHLITHSSAEGTDVDFAQYRCTKCDKRFSTLQRCRLHVRGVHLNLGRGENGAKFQCGICSRLFKIKQQLQRHMTVHTPKEDKRFMCDLCEKTYRHCETLTKHVGTAHPGYKAKFRNGQLTLVPCDTSESMSNVAAEWANDTSQ